MRRFKFVGLSLLAFLAVCASQFFNSGLPTSLNASEIATNASIPNIEQLAPVIQELPSNQTKSLLQPSVHLNHRYYPITGNTAAQLRAQMNQRGPMDQLEGRRYDAVTQWNIKWVYHYKRSHQKCTISKVEATVDINFTYPQWQKPANASPSLVRGWQRYMAALQIHEEGHKNNGVGAATEILQTLSYFPSYPDCKQLAAAANTSAQAISKRYNQRDVDYDRDTQHGSTQGAVFPA